MSRIAVLVKQVPTSPDRPMTADKTLDRSAASEMNPHCRRAVAKAVELAGTDCELVILTMGPPGAAAVLVEALTFADRAVGDARGILITDPRLAGADTLVTARVLSKTIEQFGPFDLIMAGRGTSDADTGQVTAQVAELLALPLLAAVREVDVDGDIVSARCEHDDGWYSATAPLPALITCAERLCAPCKLPLGEFDFATTEAITTLSVDDLGLLESSLISPTRVLAVERHAPVRQTRILDGPDSEHIDQISAAIVAAGGSSAPADTAEPHRAVTENAAEPGHVTLVLAEPNRPAVLAEMIGLARRTLSQTTIVVAAIGPEPAPSCGADEMLWIRGATSAEAVAATLADPLAGSRPMAFLAPATTWGREVAARYGARTGAGVIADAIAVDLRADRLVGHKCSPDGSLAYIVSDSPTQIVTIRPGTSVTLDATTDAPAPIERIVDATVRDRVRHVLGSPDLDAHALGSADIVIGIGRGVDPTEMHIVTELAQILGAQIGASRAVTDAHLLPVSRQIGITGRTIAPAVYIALGIAGKATHMLGVRHAGTVIAINTDPQAPVFGACDLGIIADWRDVAKALTGTYIGPRSTRPTPVADCAPRP